MSKATFMLALVMACLMLATALAYLPRCRSFGFSDGP